MPDLLRDKWDTETALSVSGKPSMETGGWRREGVEQDNNAEGLLRARFFCSEKGMMWTGILWAGVEEASSILP